MHTLQQLESGELKGAKHLKLALGLNEFPKEIFELSDSLEVLDLSGNHLSLLPDEMQNFKKLRVIFFADNDFTVFPEVLAKCPALTMIGFKANKIKIVPENAFPPLLQWLILTNNAIEKLPKSIGQCQRLQKCALAGNQLKALPDEMANCKNLELLRISANQIKDLPNWLFELPKLSWLAFEGNQAFEKPKKNNNLLVFDWNDFEINELLGEGASGHIYKATWKTKQTAVAIKVFKGSVTSDGLPQDEMDAAILAGSHENLIEVIGGVKNHPTGKSALVLKLIPSDFINLGNPPSLETCTRDVFEKNVEFTSQQLLKITKSTVSVCAHLHNKGINHGDLYAHNTMINPSAITLLGDFGAASFYNKNSSQAENIERLEVRAFGCFVEDVLQLIDPQGFKLNELDLWKALISDCQQKAVEKRPSFASILNQLKSLK